jgi:hypothetical protein
VAAYETVKRIYLLSGIKNVFFIKGSIPKELLKKAASRLGFVALEPMANIRISISPDIWGSQTGKIAFGVPCPYKARPIQNICRA